MRDSSRRPLPGNFGFRRNFLPLPDTGRGTQGAAPVGGEALIRRPRVFFHQGEGEFAGRAAPLRTLGPQTRPLAPPCAGEGRGHAGRGRGRGLRPPRKDQANTLFQASPRFIPKPMPAQGAAGRRRIGRRTGVEEKASGVVSPQRRRSRGPCRISPRRGSATVSSRPSLRRGGARPRRAWPGERSAPAEKGSGKSAFPSVAALYPKAYAASGRGGKYRVPKFSGRGRRDESRIEPVFVQESRQSIQSDHPRPARFRAPVTVGPRSGRADRDPSRTSKNGSS
jgi:hypothetical protein